MGEHAGVMVKGAVRAGMPEDRARAVPSHEAMTAVIKDWMTPDSLILLKASRRMALERVVEGLEAGVA
jgi:UDP-N-acetylmuramyl pentapeptide synthase